MRAITEAKGLPLRLPFAPEKNFNHVCDIRIRNVSSDSYNSRAEIELNEDIFPFDKALPDGTDIAFRDDKGVTLNHSVVNWGNGSAKINVDLDDVWNRDLRSLQMFYGKLPFPIPPPPPPTLRWTTIVRAPQHAGQSTIYSLIGYNNKLYGTTSGGMLFEWNDSDAWITRAPYLGSSPSSLNTCITHSAKHNNKLYGETHRGQLLEWNDADAWVLVAGTPSPIGRWDGLAVLEGILYGVRDYAGGLWAWNGVDLWVGQAGSAYSIDMHLLVPFNNKLYCTGSGTPGDPLYEWYTLTNYGQTKSLATVVLQSNTEPEHLIVFRNRLYGISLYYSKLRQWDGANSWSGPKASLSCSSSVGAVVVYNDELIYAANDGKLYAWNNLNAWTAVAYVPTGESYVRSLHVYDGRLFGGTYPHGQLVEYIAT